MSGAGSGTAGGTGAGGTAGGTGAGGGVKTALWIAHVTVTDAEAYGRYAALAGPALAAFGGVFLARGGRYVQLEGTERARHVVARFPSLQAAVDAYASPAYQAALAHATGASVRDLLVVEEV